MFVAWVAATFFWGASPSAQAYPRTIGYGYTSCSTCHYNPYGFGQLTDYGRALSATVMAARPPFSKANDEKLAESSGFLGRPERLPNWLRLGASFRGLYYINGLTGASPRARFIPMQLEGSVALRLGKSHTIMGTMGYAPVPGAVAAGSAASFPVLISREHYWKWQAGKSLGLIAGFMDTAFGTRVPDHIAVHRKYTGLGMNDQTHGVLLHWMPKPWEIGVHGFLGNFFQAADLRQKGASIIVERAMSLDWVLGASVLHSQNSYRQRQLLAVHSRSAHGKGSSVLIEVGLIRTTPSGSSILSEYVWLQPSLELARGIQFVMTMEHYMPIAFAGGEQLFRITPGIHWAPMQRLELRAELQTSRYFGQGVVNSDIYNFLGQVHVWL